MAPLTNAAPDIGTAHRRCVHRQHWLEFEATDTPAFRPFLASFRVGHAVPAAVSMQELAQDVNGNKIKRDKVYLRIVCARFAGLDWPFLSQQRRPCFPHVSCGAA